MRHGKEKGPTPDASAQPPDVPKAPAEQKRTFRQMWHEHFEAKKEAKRVEEEAKQREQEAQKALEALMPQLECAQPPIPAKGYITTRELEAWARQIDGWQGDICGQELARQSRLIPTSWQSRRLYFIANDAMIGGERHVRLVEFSSKGYWVSQLVPFDLNIWTRNDYFVRQRIQSARA